MTREELFKMHEDTCAKALATMKKKNHDYAESSDPFQNFKGSTVFTIPPVVGVLLRVQDKMQRINTFARKGELAVKNESVDDAIEDVINYMILIKGLIEEEKNELPK